MSDQGRAGDVTTAEDVIAAWFLHQYGCDMLIEAINSGANERPEWHPHVGHFAQAKANAESIVKALREAGVDV